MNLFPFLPTTQTGYGQPIIIPIVLLQAPQVPLNLFQPITEAALNALTFLNLRNALITGSQGYIGPTAAATSTIATSIFTSQEAENGPEIVEPVERVEREVGSPPLSLPAAASSSNPPLSTSSASTRENQIERAEAGNTERKVNESESHSGSSRSNPTPTRRKGWKVNEYWTWPRDKELVRLFNEVSQYQYWADKIKHHFPDQEIKEISGRLRYLRRKAKKTNGVLVPYPSQTGRIEGDSIKINPSRKTEHIKKSYVRGTPSEYWTWANEQRLIDAFNKSTGNHWRKEIENHFPGQSTTQIANRLNHIVDPSNERIDMTTGHIRPSPMQKDAKEGDFAILNIGKWNFLKEKNKKAQLLRKTKKTAATVIIATESLRSASTAGLPLRTTSTSSSAAATIATTTPIESSVENLEGEVVIAAGSVGLSTQETGKENENSPSSLIAAASSSNHSLSTSSTSIRETFSSNTNAEETDDSERTETEEEMSESESNSSLSSSSNSLSSSSSSHIATSSSAASTSLGGQRKRSTTSIASEGSFTKRKRSEFHK